MSQPDPPRPVVQIEGVTVIRDSKTLLQDVDWVIRPGESWVLFGANGSGKTTLLEVISTYLHATRGSVRVLGERIGRVDVRTLRSRIGYVGPAPSKMVRRQFRSVDIVVTGRHASFVATRWHHYDEADWEWARACLETLHAADLAERQFGTLSEGEQKRVLIARSLVSRPDLLLLDEPGAALDLGARERLVESLTALAANPASPPVVLVTHHVEEIPARFDHILMLADGKVVAAGPIEQVLSAATLSDTFGMPLHLERRGGRWRAWAPAAD